MEYKVIMPVLSDTMDKGKLVKWNVKEGQYVKEGDKIAEVESDKATMDVQTFKSGVVKKLLASVGDEVPVKSVIAIIDTEAKQIEKKSENEEKINKIENEAKNSQKQQNIQDLTLKTQNSKLKIHHPFQRVPLLLWLNR